MFIDSFVYDGYHQTLDVNELCDIGTVATFIQSGILRNVIQIALIRSLMALFKYRDTRERNENPSNQVSSIVSKVEYNAL